jgi:hypothetical protein
MNRRSHKSLKTSQRTEYSIQKSIHFLFEESCKNSKCSTRPNEFRLDSCREDLEIKRKTLWDAPMIKQKRNCRKIWR